MFEQGDVISVKSKVGLIDGEHVVQEIPVLKNKIQREVEVGTFVRSCECRTRT